ncbi:TonB-dependent receptor plug domain-containing protein [Paracoccus sp. (in: a-proteobacteria)]
METPQTVNVIGREQIQQQGGTTVTDALRYTPGVVAGTNGG